MREGSIYVCVVECTSVWGRGVHAVLLIVNASVRCIHIRGCQGIQEEAVDSVDKFMYRWEGIYKCGCDNV